MMSKEEFVEISTCHTSCQDCCFAQYNGKNQTGCYLDMLNYYGCAVEAYNEGGEFYIVNGRYCYFKRTKEWVEQQDNRGRDNLLVAVRKEQQIPYVCFIVVDGNMDKKRLEETIESLMSQMYPPSLINVIVEYQIGKSNYLRNDVYVGFMMGMATKYGFKWRLSSLTPGVTADDAILDFVSLYYKSYAFYLKGKPGQVIDSWATLSLNMRVSYDDFRFTCLENDGWIIGNSLDHKILRNEEFFKQCQPLHIR